MLLQKNKFRQAAGTGKILYGVWNAIPDGIVGEILGGAGFDWILIDGEHAPFDLRAILQQLQVLAAFDIPVLVRPPSGDPVFIKQLLDLGVQTLLIPTVETASDAELLVKAMHYPPLGIRGIGTAMARAAQWNRTENYFADANREMCLLVQVETRKGIDQLENILQTEAVDGVFIGPADLSASMGLIGQPEHPEVKQQMETAIRKIRAAGKIAGIMALSKELADHYEKCGANMVAVGVDTLLLAHASRQLAENYKPQPVRSGAATKY